MSGQRHSQQIALLDDGKLQPKQRNIGAYGVSIFCFTHRSDGGIARLVKEVLERFRNRCIQNAPSTTLRSFNALAQVLQPCVVLLGEFEFAATVFEEDLCLVDTACNQCQANAAQVVALRALTPLLGCGVQSGLGDFIGGQ